MEKNIAVVGGGFRGKNLIRSFHQLEALRLICDTNPRLLESYSQSFLLSKLRFLFGSLV